MKSKIKTIVVGVDFSKYSKAVVKQARTLAQKLNLPIVYVHVFEEPFVSEWTMMSILEQLKVHYEKKVRKHYGIKSESKVFVRGGQAFGQLLDVAKKFKSPLIVVGHRGKNGPVQRFFIGSTAERLALKSPFPVWIHRGGKSIIPKKVLIPCDLSMRTNHTEKSLKSLGLGKGVSAELYHVLQPPPPILDYDNWIGLYEQIKDDDSKKLKKFLQKFPHARVVNSNGDVSEQIKKHGRKSDLIAITPRLHKGAFPSFGSVTSKIVKQGDTSILVVP